MDEQQAVPNTLEPMKREEVLARAQRILDLRGEPPYKAELFDSEFPEWYSGGVTADEAAVLSEFVHYWRPFLVRKA